MNSLTLAKEKIILALDVPNLTAASQLLTRLEGELRWVKIGLRLHTSAGPRAIELALSKGLNVFLDLKFHDIPNTVAQAIESASQLGVSMTTIHLAGGPEMILEACRASGNMTILGVTVLTSADHKTLQTIGFQQEPQQLVLHLARLGIAYGLRAFVASPLEISLLRQNLTQPIQIVTPGIRTAWSESADQRRIASPAAAIRSGADYLVVGRPILHAPDPLAAFHQIASEISSCL